MLTGNDVRHKWLGCILAAGVKRFAPLVDVLLSFAASQEGLPSDMQAQSPSQSVCLKSVTLACTPYLQDSSYPVMHGARGSETPFPNAGLNKFGTSPLSSPRQQNVLLVRSQR